MLSLKNLWKFLHSLYELDSNFEVTAIIVSRTNCNWGFQTNVTPPNYAIEENPVEASEDWALLYMNPRHLHQPICGFMYFVNLNQGSLKSSTKN